MSVISSASSSQHPFLRNLSVFSLPKDLLEALSVRSIQTAEPEPEERQPVRREAEPTPLDGRLACQTCPGAVFESVDEQRVHFRSDWHRYNTKLKIETLTGKSKGEVVGLEQFEGLVEGISSLSGSISSSGSSASSVDPLTAGTDKVSRLLKKQTLAPGVDNTLDSEEEAEAEDRKRRAQLRTSIIWFTIPSTSSSPLLSTIPQDTQFGIHRALFPSTLTNSQQYLAALKGIQLRPDESPDEERRFTLLMVAGGHFAGMVVSLRQAGKNDKQTVKGAGEVRILKHKTFHRYTTRKKQGGSQSINDNAKSKANSAGAMLRRYGEQALQEEIQALLVDWAEDIHLSERIFIRASTAGKRSFWGYEGAPLAKGDERVRVFPFPTRRPTLQELIRCYHELVKVKISHLSEQALQALDDAYIASLQPKTVKPVVVAQPVPVKPAMPKMTPEQEALRERRRRFFDMIRKGKVEPLLPFWEKYKDQLGELKVQDGEGEGRGLTMLALASSSGHEEVVRWLLEDVRVDPTEPAADDSKRTAYDVASSKGVRNVYRRCAHNNAEWWDWTGAAHVPSGLTEEMEAEQGKRKTERRKGMKEKAKEREKLKAEKEVESEPEATVPVVPIPAAPSSGPQRLGGAGARPDNLAGLTPEMRARIERERRARAAEARMRG